MKATIKTVKNYLSLTILIGEKVYFFASEEALIQSLVKNHKNKIKGLVTKDLKCFNKITRGDGLDISPHDIYWKAWGYVLQEKNKYKKPQKQTKKATYGRERGYLFAMKDRDTLDEDEPKGKKVIERGFYFYEEDWYRKTERNWKSFRKTQYK